jgi:hypothetical protein
VAELELVRCSPYTVMPTLTKFRIMGVHLFGALAGVYLAAGIARIFAWFSPAAAQAAFIIIASFFCVCELCMTIRELHRGPHSTGMIILDFMPFLLLAGGLSLFLGSLASRWFGSDWGGLIVFAGIYYAVICVICGVKYRVQERNLQQDLEHPQEVDPKEVARETRKYMHPYI